jgi:hypothetical protein
MFIIVKENVSYCKYVYELLPLEILHPGFNGSLTILSYVKLLDQQDVLLQTET